jgi:hypothetical protein
MLAAASRYVLRPRPSQQHIAESSSTYLGRPWHVEMTCQCAGARRQAAEKTQHPLDPCVEGSHVYGTMRRRREHSSQGESNDLRLQDALASLEQNRVEPIVQPVQRTGRAPSSDAYGPGSSDRRATCANGS